MTIPVPALQTPAELAAEIARRSSLEAVRLLQNEPEARIAEALQLVRTVVAVDVLALFPEPRRHAVLENLPKDLAAQWALDVTFAEGTIGRLMEPAVAVFSPGETVKGSTEVLRELVKHVFVTYGWVVDEDRRLEGVITFRDLHLSDEHKALGEIMLRSPFSLRPETELTDAMKQVLNRHFPVYPVCDAHGKLIGQVRGQAMFEEQAIEISAQAGTMVGVDKEERLATPWARSLKFRHPWLQLNLLTAFVAAAVVGVFQNTIDRFVILAMFLPVLAGQSGNTGCQALAVTLRGMTLGELRRGRERALILKEALLGSLNGGFVGLTAGLGMYVVARAQDNPNALGLGAVVWAAMVGSCVISGLSGALIPLTLRRLGADPATASSIFLTTATDVASMGLLLGLATVFVL